MPDHLGEFKPGGAQTAPMKHVRVRITARGKEDDIHPMYGVLTGAPFVERATAIQWNYTGDALGILHFVVGDADAFERALQDVPEVVGYDLLRTDRGFYAYVRDATTTALGELFEPVTHGGLVAVPPIRYREDGTVSFSLFGPDAELQAAIDAVPDPVEVCIEAVGGLAGAAAAETRLSGRQREALETGLSLGYYDVPRRCSGADVAEAMECAPSTAAEHLRRGEASLVRSVLDGA